MNKELIVKLFESDGTTFKKTLSGKREDGSSIATRIAFSKKINYGHGPLYFTYTASFGDDTIDYFDVVKVIDADTDDIIYRGCVVEIENNLNSNGEYQNIKCFGHQFYLSKKLYTDSSNYTFTKNDDPSTIIQDILDQAQFSLFTYTDMVAYGSNVNIEFENDTLQTALNKVLDIVDYHFTIQADGNVIFQPKSAGNEHVLSIGKEIVSIRYTGEVYDFANDIRLEWASGTNTGDNASSISEYFEMEEHFNSSDVNDTTTADEKIATILDKYSSPSETTVIVVNRQYTLENIEVGDTIRLQNLPIILNNKLIHKVDYKTDTATLYLEGYESLEKSLSSI